MYIIKAKFQGTRFKRVKRVCHW